MSASLTCEAIACTLGSPAKKTGKELVWRCPNHDDRNPSLSVNPSKNAWLCGPCGVSGNAWQLAAFLAKVSPDDKPAVTTWLRERGLLSGAKRKTVGLTLACYAEAKRLPESFLTELGVSQIVHNGQPALEIPYRRDGGQGVARRLRLALTGERRFLWEPGTKLIPYGLWRLNQEGPDYMVLVEGESDCHTLWYHGVPALGIPGVATWRDEWASTLARFKRVYAVIEPDRGGETFRAKLAQSTLRDRLSFVLLPAKDVSELHIENADTFDARLAEAVARAVPAIQDGAALIREAEVLFKRFIVAPSGTALIASLYAAMTYAFRAFGWIGYLAFCSPLEECGKSRAASIVGWLSHDFEIVVNVSGPALYRTIEARHPTIVVDEAEILQGDTETAQILRAILHPGCSPDDAVLRYNAESREVERFVPWCPKIFCAIGELPRVLASRTVTIPMQRKRPGQCVGLFVRRKVKAACMELGLHLAAWAAANETRVREIYESLPDSSLDGRDAENFAPLEAVLRVADPSRLAEFNVVRERLIGSRQKAAAGDSAGLRLLADIREIFTERKVCEMSSSELAGALAKIETSPWGEWSKGSPLSPAKLARLLKPFQVWPDRIGGKDSQARGYTLAWFQDAFACYLPLESVNPSTPRENSGDGEGFKASTETLVDTLGNAIPANKNAAAGQVDTLKAGIEPEDSKKAVVEWEA